MHFSRKCAERPFEHVLSLLRLIPWYSIDNETVKLMFEMLKLSIEALVLHQSRPNNSFDEGLLTRLVQAGVNNPNFDFELKSILQRSATMFSNWKIVLRPVQSNTRKDGSDEKIEALANNDEIKNGQYTQPSLKGFQPC